MNNFKEKVIYQIYPRSFKDSNGDGIGDLPGIIEKLPYLRDLGIDMIWLSPIYTSPQKDNGYDVADYYGIDPVFGTMADFERLVEEAGKMDIEIMLDMVFNHTSTEHDWFKKALAGEEKYQDYYILRPRKRDGRLPTNWQSKFGGPAWEQFGNKDLYYLHLFDVTQADLNWRNPSVRKELAKVIKFWQKKGVKGFRFDVINLIGKDVVLTDALSDEEKSLYTDRPIAHEFIREMNKGSFGESKDCLTVGEMSATTIENCLCYTQPERNELSMAFNFHHLKVDYENGEKWTDAPFDFQSLTELFHSWGEAMSVGNGWSALFWNNHDQPRSVSRFGDTEKYRIKSAQMLAASIHLSRGTPFIYQGEEIGMTNPNYSAISHYDDIESLNIHERYIKEGMPSKEVMSRIQSKSRDNSRTPVQWNSDKNAGFSTGEPWLRVADNYHDINVEAELAIGEIFSFYQQLIRLRKNVPVIASGDYQKYSENHEQLYSYIRQLGATKLLVINNFYGEETTISIPIEFLNGVVLLNNYEDAEVKRELIIRPYETLGILI